MKVSRVTSEYGPAKRDSAFGRTVRTLRQICLDAEEGAFLGSEPDIQQRLGISRPTLRQAAKVLESDQLLAVRRGLNGGFFATRPDASHAIKGPALYLHLQNATLDQMNRATMLIFPEAGAAAATCTDPELRAELCQFRRDMEHDHYLVDDPRSIIHAELVFVRLILRMAADPVLSLFMEISYSFGLLGQTHAFYRTSPERGRLWLELQRTYCDAILSGDAEVSRLIGNRRGRTISMWINEDLAAAGTLAMGEARAS